MTVFVDDPDFTLHVGDALDVLAGLPDESVHCVVTSPPYWGLRDYGTGSWEGGDDGCDHDQRRRENDVDSLSAKQIGPSRDSLAGRDTCRKCGARRTDHQLGLEPTPDEYVANMVNVFREVRRVLRRDGTCWLNIGDSYSSNPKGLGGDDSSTLSPSGTRTQRTAHLTAGPAFGLKIKDLVGIPWRLAFALQADGWYLRSDVIWSKPNPMPESVTDRPTKAHEYLFLLSRSPRYFYDADAIREMYAPASEERYKYAFGGAKNEALAEADKSGIGVRTRPIGMRDFKGATGPDRHKTTVLPGDGTHENHQTGERERWPNGGRNKRSVWEIATQPYPDAHFATFPQALVEPCVLAGTSERGCCPECGAPWERETDVSYEKSPVLGAGSVVGRHYETGANNYDGAGMPRLNKRVETTGWRPTCECFGHIEVIPEIEVIAGTEDRVKGEQRVYVWDREPPTPQPGVVLDPFMGSGTTALVARRLGRRSVGIELSAEYATLAAERLQQLSLFADA